MYGRVPFQICNLLFVQFLNLKVVVFLDVLFSIYTIIFELARVWILNYDLVLRAERGRGARAIRSLFICFLWKLAVFKQTKLSVQLLGEIHELGPQVGVPPPVQGLEQSQFEILGPYPWLEKPHQSDVYSKVKALV